MNNRVSIQIEMKVSTSDSMVLELPEGVTQEEFNDIAEECAKDCEYIDEWINRVRQLIYGKTDKYPKMHYKSRVYEESELELLQLENGDLFSEDE